MISLVLCTYNGEKYIEKQLTSIVNQTVLPDEIIVCDDISIDDTLNIIYSFKEKYNNIKWQVIKNKNKLGFANNFINALKFANGDYIFLSDQDDIWELDKISNMLNIIENNNKINILFSSYDCIDQNDMPINYKYTINKSIFYNFLSKIFKVVKYTYFDFIKSMNVAGMSMCIKKSFLDSFLSLKVANLKYHDLFLALFASLIGSLYFYNNRLVKYRMHDNNLIGLKSAIGIKEDRKEWLLYNIENQKLMKHFLLNNDCEKNRITELNELIKFNLNRIEIMKSKSLLRLLNNIKNIRFYSSIFAYFGDFYYILNN